MLIKVSLLFFICHIICNIMKFTYNSCILLFSSMEKDFNEEVDDTNKPVNCEPDSDPKFEQDPEDDDEEKHLKKYIHEYVKSLIIKIINLCFDAVIQIIFIFIEKKNILYYLKHDFQNGQSPIK